MGLLTNDISPLSGTPYQPELSNTKRLIRDQVEMNYTDIFNGTHLSYTVFSGSIWEDSASLNFNHDAHFNLGAI